MVGLVSHTLTHISYSCRPELMGADKNEPMQPEQIKLVQIKFT